MKTGQIIGLVFGSAIVIGGGIYLINRYGKPKNTVKLSDIGGRNTTPIDRGLGTVVSGTGGFTYDFTKLGCIPGRVNEQETPNAPEYIYRLKSRNFETGVVVYELKQMNQPIGMNVPFTSKSIMYVPNPNDIALVNQAKVCLTKTLML